MKQGQCAFEEKIAAASRSGQWSDELLAHVGQCRSCEEVALVSSYLCESSDSTRADTKLPNAGVIWSKAQATRRAEAMERALRPILWARRFAFASCAMAIVAVVVLAWSRIGEFFASFVESWGHHSAPSFGHSNVLLIFTAAFLLILFPLIFGLYASWSED